MDVQEYLYGLLLENLFRRGLNLPSEISFLGNNLIIELVTVSGLYGSYLFIFDNISCKRYLFEWNYTRRDFKKIFSRYGYYTKGASTRLYNNDPNKKFSEYDILESVINFMYNKNYISKKYNFK